MDIIFLHGALGCKKHWEPIAAMFGHDYNIHLLDFPSHGSSNLNYSELQYLELVDFVKKYILENNISEYVIIGYSLGGYVGLKLAQMKCFGLSKLITVATKLSWDLTISERESNQLNQLEHLVPKFEKEHGLHSSKLINNTKSILNSIGVNPLKKEDFNSLSIPVYLLVGEIDNMVTQIEIDEFIEGNIFMKKMVLPNQPHLLQKMNIEILVKSIKDCLL